MEVDNHTTHIHIPSVEEIVENIQKESEDEVSKLVRQILEKGLH